MVSAPLSGPDPLPFERAGRRARRCAGSMYPVSGQHGGTAVPALRLKVALGDETGGWAAKGEGPEKPRYVLRR